MTSNFVRRHSQGIHICDSGPGWIRPFGLNQGAHGSRHCGVCPTPPCVQEHEGAREHRQSNPAKRLDDGAFAITKADRHLVRESKILEALGRSEYEQICRQGEHSAAAHKQHFWQQWHSPQSRCSHESSMLIRVTLFEGSNFAVVLIDRQIDRMLDTLNVIQGQTTQDERLRNTRYTSGTSQKSQRILHRR